MKKNKNKNKNTKDKQKEHEIIILNNLSEDADDGDIKGRYGTESILCACKKVKSNNGGAILALEETENDYKAYFPVKNLYDCISAAIDELNINKLKQLYFIIDDNFGAIFGDKRFMFIEIEPNFAMDSKDDNNFSPIKVYSVANKVESNLLHQRRM